MRHLRDIQQPGGTRQRGAAAVEFALIAMVFFTLLLGIIEFGRFLYIWNTVQEVTRRAAREAVVLWVNQSDTAKSRALFGGESLPAGAEITAESINIRYLNASKDEATPLPADATDNISACLDTNRASSCIRFVEASLTAQYVPMVGLFTFLAIDIPPSTVVMPAESLGYTPFTP